MKEREELIRLWLDMWLRGEDFGIRDVFALEAVYTESWGPVYHGVDAIVHWFREWLTRGQVLVWDVHRFFHAGDQTAVTWFSNARWAMRNQSVSRAYPLFTGQKMGKSAG